MTWRLVYTERAARDIRTLDPGARARIGDYRVIFDISGTDLVILRVGHRSSIYR